MALKNYLNFQKFKIFSKNSTNFQEEFLEKVNAATEKKILDYVVNTSYLTSFSSIEEIRASKKYLAFENVNDLLNDYPYFNENYRISTKKWNFSLLSNFNFVAKFVGKNFFFAKKTSVWQFRLIFLLFFLFLPISYSIFFRIITSSWYPNFDFDQKIYNPNFVAPIIYLVGFFFLFRNLRFVFSLSMGGLPFIFFQVGIFIFSIFASIIFEATKEIFSLDDNQKALLMVFLQDIFEIFLVYYCLKKCHLVKNNLLNNLKKNWFIIIITTIGLFLVFLLISQLLNLIGISFFVFLSDNQDNLEKIIKSGIFPAIFMFFTTVFVAPICEELVFRDGVYKILGNKYLSLFSSAIIFSFIHVNVDIEHFFSYFPAALLLSLTYFWKKSTAYTIPLHSTLNVMAFIGIFYK